MKIADTIEESTTPFRRQYIDSKTSQLRLYYTQLAPVSPVASIAIVHGLGQHSERFEHVAQFFCNEGFHVHMIDLRGFGMSGGGRGCSKIEELQTDLLCLLERTNEQLPLFIYAHSMGALVTTQFLSANPSLPVAGVVLTSPLLGLPRNREMNWVKQKGLQIIGGELEELVVNTLINPTALTKNNMQVKKIFSDRMMIPFIGLGMAKSLISHAAQVLSKAPLFKHPLLVLHGLKDTICACEDSVAFVDKVGSRIAKLKTFPNGYHQLQNDQECKQLLKEVKGWLGERLSSRPAARGKWQISSIKFGRVPRPKKMWLLRLILVGLVWLASLYLQTPKSVTLRRAIGIILSAGIILH